MVDFTLTLPAEIVSNIFGYLHQKDCIGCMLVCKQWHELFPGYIHSTTVWQDLTISPESWNKVSDSALRCLGPHVKNVSIQSHDACVVLEGLDRQRCGIKSLGKKKRPSAHYY